MKRNLLLLAVVISVAFGFTAAQAQDNGVPDTLYVDIWPGDEVIDPGLPHLARFPIRVTNDIPNPVIDSIAGFVIPLCYTRTNPGAYCSLSSYWNNTNVHPSGGLDQSIFRHLPDMATEEETNWMMHISENSPVIPLEWDTRILDLDGTSHFWLTLLPTGTADQRFPGGSRVLLATMTFKMEDTMTVCIDSCFWPLWMRLAFSRSDAVTYLPCHYPTCEVIAGGPETWITCPPAEARSANGVFQSGGFLAGCDGGVVTGVQLCGEPPPGISDVEAVFTTPLGQPNVEGYLTYTVSDHCLGSADIQLCVFNDFHGGPAGDCHFPVTFGNNPPAINLPDTWRALSGYTMTLHVPASDVDGDAVDVTGLDGFWYEPDSLRSAINPPSFDGGNPALFTWVPDQSETGNWICSFTAADACGAEVTHQLSIEVGMLYCGDCNSDGELNVADGVYLLSDLFKNGPPPDPICKGDANCSGVRDVGDVVVLINYLFRSGPLPCFDCCPGGS